MRRQLLNPLRYIPIRIGRRSLGLCFGGFLLLIIFLGIAIHELPASSQSCIPEKRHRLLHQIMIRLKLRIQTGQIKTALQ